MRVLLFLSSRRYTGMVVYFKSIPKNSYDHRTVVVVLYNTSSHRRVNRAYACWEILQGESLQGTNLRSGSGVISVLHKL